MACDRSRRRRSRRSSRAHFGPAFTQALTAHKGEIARHRDARSQADRSPTPSSPSKRAATLLTKVADVFFNLSSADSNDALQAIERDIAPKLAQHQSAVLLNRRLFQRIADLYERRDALGLDAEAHRLLERTYKGFVRAGATLDSKSRKRIAEINTELATLGTAFTQNVLADEQAWHMMLDGERDLAGLPTSVRDAAAQAAVAARQAGQHAITLARSSVEPFLQFSARRDLREEAFKAWIRRGENGGKTDNRKIVVAHDGAPQRGGPPDRLRHLRRLRARRHDGQDARRGARAARQGLAGGAPQGARRARRARNARPRGRREFQDRRLGLALLRREGAQGAL